MWLSVLAACCFTFATECELFSFSMLRGSCWDLFFLFLLLFLVSNGPFDTYFISNSFKFGICRFTFL